jgi:hypothetical protein
MAILELPRTIASALARLYHHTYIGIPPACLRLDQQLASHEQEQRVSTYSTFRFLLVSAEYNAEMKPRVPVHI